MTKKFNYSIIIFLLSIVVCSCRKDKPEEPNETQIWLNESSVFISNEGNFQFGNASISYYSPELSEANTCLFQKTNNRPLGDICQSIKIFNGKAYIIVNNSGKIEVVNVYDFKSVATISGLVSPRYFLPVSNNKAYVSDLYANSISIVDLSTNTISGNINCSGWTEEMLLAYGKAFITNYDKPFLYVVNTTNDMIIDSINIGFGANSIIEDKNGKIWVLCSGLGQAQNKASLHKINPISHLIEKTLDYPNVNDNPWKLKINAHLDTLYFLNTNVYRISVNATGLPNTAFIEAANKNFYGLDICKNTNRIYVSDAIDYIQEGVVYIHSHDGKLIVSFNAGINPGGFVFK